MTVVLLTIALSWTPPLQRKFVRGAFPRVADPSLLIASQGGNGGGGGSGGGTITFDNDKMLALGDSLKKLELIFFSPTSLAIIMMCILPITLLWLTDHPERENVEGTPKLLSLRLHAALDILGFFSHFGLVTAIFLTTEVAMTLSHGTIWAGHQPLVKLMVAYTGASHFLYGVHALAVGFLPDRFARLRDFLSMGLGGLMLKSERSAVKAVAFVEHKLLDVTMHLMGALSLGYHRPLALRLAHVVMFGTHFARYFDHAVPLAENTMVPFGRKKLPVGDVVDVIAHSATSFILLGRSGFAAALVVSELLRAWLELDYEKRTHGSAKA